MDETIRVRGRLSEIFMPDTHFNIHFGKTRINTKDLEQDPDKPPQFTLNEKYMCVNYRYVRPDGKIFRCVKKIRIYGGDGTRIWTEFTIK